jgi:Bacterial PH domain
VTRIRFRHHSGIAVAGLIATVGTLPFALSAWYLAPILLVPVAVTLWGWLAGTDADPDGVTIRALLGRRRLPWSRISGFVPEGRRVLAALEGGGAMPLPAVTPAELPTLLAASGQERTAQ